MRSGGWESTSWRQSRGSGGARRSVSTGSGGPPRPTGPKSSGAHLLGIAVGDDVRHAKWGEGVVLDLTGEGDKVEVVVRFPEVGEKRLLLAWAPLEKAGAGASGASGEERTA